MPALPPTEKPVDAADLRPVRRYELGLVAFGETILAVIELEPSKGPTVQYAMSLASAVTFCADLTSMIESDAGIEALVRATLADARVLKARGVVAETPPADVVVTFDEQGRATITPPIPEEG